MQRKVGQYWLHKCENWTNFITDPPVICAMINADKPTFLITVVSLQMYSFLSLLIFIHSKLSFEFLILLMKRKCMNKNPVNTVTLFIVVMK